MEENVSYDFVMVAPNVCVVFSIMEEKKKKKKKFEKKTKKKVVVNTQIKIFPQNKTVSIFLFRSK